MYTSIYICIHPDIHLCSNVVTCIERSSCGGAKSIWLNIWLKANG